MSLLDQARAQDATAALTASLALSATGGVAVAGVLGAGVLGASAAALGAGALLGSAAAGASLAGGALAGALATLTGAGAAAAGWPPVANRLRIRFSLGAAPVWAASSCSALL